MVKLGWSFSGKLGKDIGAQDGAAMDSVPLISPLDVSQLQPSFPDQVGLGPVGGPSQPAWEQRGGEHGLFRSGPSECQTAGRKPQGHMRSAPSSPRASAVLGSEWGDLATGDWEFAHCLEDSAQCMALPSRGSADKIRPPPPFWAHCILS